MNNNLFDLNNIRIEISFKSFEELRQILSFYQSYNLYKINIPCKNSLKKDFLLESIKISKHEFPNIDIIPHFSILHEFRRNRHNTLNSLIKFIQVVKYSGCREFLLVSGSQRRSTLDSVSSLSFLRDYPEFLNEDFSIGVAFNPYLPRFLFDEEILRLEWKLKTGLVSSIWIQFGTDYKLLKSRIEILSNLILMNMKNNSNTLNIKLFGSILIPSNQFLARFKYRPWKGVYCSNEFFESVNSAKNLVIKLLKTYKQYEICPIIENISATDNSLISLEKIIRKSRIVQ